MTLPTPSAWHGISPRQVRFSSFAFAWRPFLQSYGKRPQQYLLIGKLTNRIHSQARQELRLKRQDVVLWPKEVLANVQRAD